MVEGAYQVAHDALVVVVAGDGRLLFRCHLELVVGVAALEEEVDGGDGVGRVLIEVRSPTIWIVTRAPGAAGP